MRLVVQRVLRASVTVESEVVGQIGRGLLVLLGVGRGDREEDVEYLSEKLLDLRVFPDENSSMNRSLRDVGGEILLVSQFTLYGDCRKGRRPSFDRAESPDRARALCELWAGTLRDKGFPPAEGIFGASMQVELLNDGPVTLLLDSRREF